MTDTTNDLIWRKSSRSGGGDNCVEIAPTPDGIAVRDSKDPSGLVLRFTADDWRSFVHGVRDGEFDV